jgi:hypothetical protein
MLPIEIEKSARRYAFQDQGRWRSELLIFPGLTFFREEECQWVEIRMQAGLFKPAVFKV